MREVNFKLHQKIPYEEKNGFFEFEIEDSLRYFGSKNTKEDLANYKTFLRVRKEMTKIQMRKKGRAQAHSPGHRQKETKKAQGSSALASDSNHSPHPHPKATTKHSSIPSYPDKKSSPEKVIAASK